MSVNKNGTYLNIPSELMDFVKQDTYSLLIKGYAGAGKTTLALTILRILGIKENFQYISTRISPGKLFEYYPWLGKFFGNIEKYQLPDSEENSTETPTFVDARLDEPSSMFERITHQLMDTGSQMIIIDSWDAVGYFMDKDALMNNARVLQTWRERAKAKMIFISENPTDTTFDVLVDGIVELRQIHHDNRLIREIVFSKLHGVRIDRPSYVYTLNDSVFRSFKPYNPSEFTIHTSPKDKQTHQKKVSLFDGHFIKTGNVDLDISTGGGFPLKGIVNINLDPHVNSKMVLAFLGEIISNLISEGAFVLCKHSQGTDTNYMTNYLNQSLGKAQVDQNILFMLNVTKNNKTAKKTVKNPSLIEAATKIKNKNPGKLLIALVFSEALNGFAEDSIKEFSKLKSASDLTIIVNTNSQEIHDFMSKHSDISIRFLKINGTLFMQSEIPWSQLYAVTVDQSSGYPRIRLESIV
ncbi:MAG: RAD55 family ATPase [Nitrososphaerales archaeon]